MNKEYGVAFSCKRIGDFISINFEKTCCDWFQNFPDLYNSLRRVIFSSPHVQVYADITLNVKWDKGAISIYLLPPLSLAKELYLQTNYMGFVNIYY